MKIDRDATIKKHFDMLHTLTNRLNGDRLSVFSHSYNYLSFGNWEIVIGSGHKEKKFFWDGRDFNLTVSERNKTNLCQNNQWSNVNHIPLGEISDEELFERVYQIAVQI
jgi:hypothetical protein